MGHRLAPLHRQGSHYFRGLDELLDTSARSEITKTVEMFESRFPLVPILATSRRIGYKQAPLDSSIFVTYQLAAFSDEQVAEYAHKWFELDGGIPEVDGGRLSAAFLSESRVVPDLRSNPLLLALMCSIYRGESYIPRNRPDVYEKCAMLLFDRWDRFRGLRQSLPFEAHLEPAMRALADWIFTDPKLQAGVTEAQLVSRAAQYLETHLYTDAPNEAEEAARSFIQFCRGRAWVFTDMGTTASGDTLYQFTHSTFLEYFAASHFARNSSTYKRLLSTIVPHVRRAEWDVVSQLAVQIFSRSHDGAAEQILNSLVDRASVPRASLGSRGKPSSILHQNAFLPCPAS